MGYQHKGGEILVNTMTEGPQFAPKMARLSNGGFVILWLDFTGTNRGQIFDADGNKVGGEFETAGWHVTGLPGGGFAAMWYDQTDVRVQIYDSAGEEVGPSFLANSSTDGNQNPESITTLASGDFVVTWSDHNVSGDADVLGQRFSADGARVGPEFVVANDAVAPGDQLHSEVTGLAGGGFVVTWEYEANVRAQVFDSAGARVGSEYQVNTSATYVDDARIAALSSGGFVIIWTKDVNLGGFEADKGIYGQIFNANGARIGSEFLVSPDETELSGSANVAALATGGFVVTWSADTDGSGWGVKAQVFDDLGNKVGAELLANTTRSEDQYEPAVVGLPSGEFVISWADRSQTGGDTSEAAVRSQLFHSVAPIEGTADYDFLTGTPLNDEMFGYEGNDELRGRAGNDVLDGGAGNDIIRGRAGDDILIVSGVGSDMAAGGTGFDTLVLDYSDATSAISTSGPVANQTIGGFNGIYDDSNGHDVWFESIERIVVTGGSGDDILVTADGDDVIDGGAGEDFMAGGFGNDVYEVDCFGDEVHEHDGEGRDSVRTALGTRDFLYVLPDFVEKLVGTSAGAQGVRGNGLDNVVVMGAGHDLILLHDGGVDLVHGGDGNDFIYYGDALTAASDQRPSEQDITNGGAGIDTVGLLGHYADLTFTAANLIGIERLALFTGGGSSSYAITMHDANVAPGAEFFVTAASLIAGETLTFDGTAETNGRFTVHGGAGADTIAGGGGGDFLIGNAGNDSLYGLAGTDFLIGGLGADQLRGGAGADRFVYQSTAQSTAAGFDRIADFQHVDRIDLSAIDANGNGADGNSAFTFIGSDAFHNVAGELRAWQSGANWFVEGDVNGDGVADLVIQVTLPDATPLGAGDFML